MHMFTKFTQENCQLQRVKRRKEKIARFVYLNFYNLVVP